MRDEYDDMYKDIDFNCSLVRSLRWSFFGVGVNKCAEKKIIEHLLKCKKCRQEYEDYAKKVNWGKFDVYDLAQKFKKKYEADDSTQYTWIDKYKNKEVIKLAASKAIREIIMYENNVNFQRFLTKKMCQKLDHLENCYNKEEIKTNEKSK